MREVLITGASGFIGRKTVELARQRDDWRIHAAVNQSNCVFPDGVIVHKVDLTDERDCKRLLSDSSPDIIIHLAWSLSEKDYSASVSNLIWLESSLFLLRHFFGEGGKRFVFAGSASIYGEPGGRHTENYMPISRTVYGESKAAFEQICDNYCKKHGLEFVTARCFPVYGEGDNRSFKAIPAAIRAFIEHKQFVCKGPGNVWDYTHVDDAAGALVEISASDYCGIVNVGTGIARTMREVFCEIADKMGCRQLLSLEENEQSVTIQVADTRILNEKIGYQCKVNFSEGLNRTIEWWKHKIIDLGGNGNE